MKMNSDKELYEAKKAIRRKILKLRGEIPESERRTKSEKIYGRLCREDAFINASVIFFFAGYGTEVRTDFMIEDAMKKGKKIALPKVVSDTEIEFYFINSPNDLAEGYKGIPEPHEKAEKALIDPELIVMPGLAFDHERNRTGYGRGYYDRYLAQLKGQTKSIAICFDEQILDTIPSEENDIKPDRIISDKRIIN